MSYEFNILLTFLYLWGYFYDNNIADMFGIERTMLGCHFLEWNTWRKQDIIYKVVTKDVIWKFVTMNVIKKKNEALDPTGS